MAMDDMVHVLESMGLLTQQNKPERVAIKEARRLAAQRKSKLNYRADHVFWANKSQPRNQRCKCGSGAKFKYCCLRSEVI